MFLFLIILKRFLESLLILKFAIPNLNDKHLILRQSSCFISTNDMRSSHSFT
jgi:hypothetical protein